MPYVTCPTCAVRAYRTGRETCPCCGASAGAAAPAGPLPRVAATSPLPDMLALVRTRIGSDAVLVTEVVAGREIVRGVDQDGAFPGLGAGLSAALRDTICERLLAGRIGSLVGDVRADPELAGLPLVRLGGVGAYLGVPITTADARTYLLCCLALEARPDLGDDDVRFVRGVAGRVRATIDAYGPDVLVASAQRPGQDVHHPTRLDG